MGLANIITRDFKAVTSPDVWTKYAAALYAEVEYQRKEIFVWFPVFLAFGIGIYFSLPIEPPLALGIVSLMFSLVPLIALDRERRVMVMLIVLIALGFLCAQIRTHLVHTPILQKELGPVTVEGTIAAIEDMGDAEGSRLTLTQLSVEKLDARKTPKKVRLRFRKDMTSKVGQRIRVLAHLHAPSGPVMPGGFDFQRYLYFQEIGAVGFIYKDLEVLDAGGWPWIHLIESWRYTVAEKVEVHMQHPQAAIAMALMVGRKTAITEEDKEAMREAGLAHMLAISGLHLGLFSGVLFFFSRFLLACIPGLALNYPIKKYAAVLAMIGACFYMLLAGATIPTQRALLMTGMVFLAVILDRSPISLRLVAFAALVVLILFPESLLSASFHMSFAAVIALIVFYSWLRPFWSSWYAQAGRLKRAALYLAGVCFTTVIASLATAPFALFHFQQVAVYSLIANVVAMPIMAFMVMPAVVVTVLLMPLGFEGLAFWVLDFAILSILDVAHWVSSLPYAVLKV